jgi:hypothetical protein
MKKLLISASLAAALALISAPAMSQTAITASGSGQITSSASGVVTHGLAVGVAAGNQVNTGQAAGVAVNTPAGSLTAAISQNQSLGNSSTFTAGALGGSAAAANTGFNLGAAGSVANTH